MDKWKQIAAAAAISAVLTASFPMPVFAADGYYNRAVDDNQQYLYLLTTRTANRTCFSITADAQQRQVLYEAAQSITRGCTTDVQKAAAIYDWVTQNIYYDWDAVSSGNFPAEDPYSVYTGRRAICEGYTSLFAELMNLSGIPCVSFHGASISDPQGISSDSQSTWNQSEYDLIDHAWNAAYIGGQWLYYDTTWDSSNMVRNGNFIKDASSRTYFGVTGSVLGANHRTAYRVNDTGGYVLKNGEWVFCDAEGSPLTGIWYDVYNSAMYYLEDGQPLTGRSVVNYQLVKLDGSGKYLGTCYDYTGWQLCDGDWYYIQNGVACYGWGYLGGKWYYMDETTSIMQTGWRFLGGNWYYFGSDGAMRTGWAYAGGAWYYLNSSGVMQTGWRYLNGKWYYLNSSGAMATGWRWLDGKWYYLNADGSMAIGWKLVGGKWYYLNGSGVMQTGWQRIGGKWYYLNADGSMATGWKFVDGKWYYLQSDGSMAVNTWIDGYYLNGSGTY